MNDPYERMKGFEWLHCEAGYAFASFPTGAKAQQRYIAAALKRLAKVSKQYEGWGAVLPPVAAAEGIVRFVDFARHLAAMFDDGVPNDMEPLDTLSEWGALKVTETDPEALALEFWRIVSERRLLRAPD